ncbi:MAG: hypothetical protein ABSF67_23870 [Roseiarcus sp.]|jgi:hypothetical protein
MVEARNRENHERANARAREFAPLLCALRDQGATMSGIAESLTQMGVPTPNKASRWGYFTIRSMFERAGLEKPKSARGHRRNATRALANPRVPLFLGSLNGLQL